MLKQQHPFNDSFPEQPHKLKCRTIPDFYEAGDDGLAVA